MGQNRGLYAAVAVFAAAVAIYFFADRLQSGKAPSSSPSPAPSPVVGLAATHLDQVVLHGKGKVLTVSREGAGWTYSLCPDGQAACPSAPADPTRTTQFFEAVAAMTPGHVIFGAPEGLPAYGVDKPTTGELDVKGTGGEQVTVLLGGKIPDGSSYFVRRQDSNDIYTVAVSTIDQELFGLVDSPPVPQPSPAPGAASPSP